MRRARGGRTEKRASACTPELVKEKQQHHRQAHLFISFIWFLIGYKKCDIFLMLMWKSKHSMQNIKKINIWISGSNSCFSSSMLSTTETPWQTCAAWDLGSAAEPLKHVSNMPLFNLSIHFLWPLILDRVNSHSHSHLWAILDSSTNLTCKSLDCGRKTRACKLYTERQGSKPRTF